MTPKAEAARNIPNEVKSQTEPSPVLQVVKMPDGAQRQRPRLKPELHFPLLPRRKDVLPLPPQTIDIVDFTGAKRTITPQVPEINANSKPIRERAGRRKGKELASSKTDAISEDAAVEIVVQATLSENERSQQAVISSEEARLVTAAKAGDGDAFGELVQATQADVYTLAYRIVGNEEDARDVAQDAYLRAFRSLKRFRGDAKFSVWMYRITANAASTELKRRSRNRHDELSDDDHVPDERPESDPESMAEAGALRDKVTAVLQDLPKKQRAVVVLRDVYDLPHDAIAEELGITESASKKRLHDARKKLREKLFPMPGEEKARDV